MRLLGPLGLVAPLFYLGTGYWLSVSCFQSPRMGPLVEYWLVVLSQRPWTSVGPSPVPWCLLPRLGVSIPFSEAHRDWVLVRDMEQSVTL